MAERIKPFIPDYEEELDEESPVFVPEYEEEGDPGPLGENGVPTFTPEYEEGKQETEEPSAPEEPAVVEPAAVAEPVAEKAIEPTAAPREPAFAGRPSWWDDEEEVEFESYIQSAAKKQGVDPAGKDSLALSSEIYKSYLQPGWRSVYTRASAGEVLSKPDVEVLRGLRESQVFLSKAFPGEGRGDSDGDILRNLAELIEDVGSDEARKKRIAEYNKRTDEQNKRRQARQAGFDDPAGGMLEHRALSLLDVGDWYKPGQTYVRQEPELRLPGPADEADKDLTEAFVVDYDANVMSQAERAATLESVKSNQRPDSPYVVDVGPVTRSAFHDSFTEFAVIAKAVDPRRAQQLTKEEFEAETGKPFSALEAIDSRYMEFFLKAGIIGGGPRQSVPLKIGGARHGIMEEMALRAGVKDSQEVYSSAAFADVLTEIATVALVRELSEDHDVFSSELVDKEAKRYAGDLGALSLLVTKHLSLPEQIQIAKRRVSFEYDTLRDLEEKPPSAIEITAELAGGTKSAIALRSLKENSGYDQGMVSTEEMLEAWNKTSEGNDLIKAATESLLARKRGGARAKGAIEELRGEPRAGVDRVQEFTADQNRYRAVARRHLKATGQKVTEHKIRALAWGLQTGHIPSRAKDLLAVGGVKKVREQPHEDHVTDRGSDETQRLLAGPPVNNGKPQVFATPEEAKKAGVLNPEKTKELLGEMRDYLRTEFPYMFDPQLNKEFPVPWGEGSTEETVEKLSEEFVSGIPFPIRNEYTRRSVLKTDGVEGFWLKESLKELDAMGVEITPELLWGHAVGLFNNDQSQWEYTQAYRQQGVDIAREARRRDVQRNREMIDNVEMRWIEDMGGVKLNTPHLYQDILSNVRFQDPLRPKELDATGVEIEGTGETFDEFKERTERKAQSIVADHVMRTRGVSFYRPFSTETLAQKAVRDIPDSLSFLRIFYASALPVFQGGTMNPSYIEGGRNSLTYGDLKGEAWLWQVFGMVPSTYAAVGFKHGWGELFDPSAHSLEDVGAGLNIFTGFSYITDDLSSMYQGIGIPDSVADELAFYSGVLGVGGTAFIEPDALVATIAGVRKLSGVFSAGRKAVRLSEEIADELHRFSKITDEAASFEEQLTALETLRANLAKQRGAMSLFRHDVAGGLAKMWGPGLEGLTKGADAVGAPLTDLGDIIRQIQVLGEKRAGIVARRDSLLREAIKSGNEGKLLEEAAQLELEVSRLGWLEEGTNAIVHRLRNESLLKIMGKDPLLAKVLDEGITIGGKLYRGIEGLDEFKRSAPWIDDALDMQSLELLMAEKVAMPVSRRLEGAQGGIDWFRPSKKLPLARVSTPSEMGTLRYTPKRKHPRILGEATARPPLAPKGRPLPQLSIRHDSPARVRQRFATARMHQGELHVLGAKGREKIGLAAEEVARLEKIYDDLVAETARGGGSAAFRLRLLELSEAHNKKMESLRGLAIDIEGQRAVIKEMRRYQVKHRTLIEEFAESSERNSTLWRKLSDTRTEINTVRRGLTAAFEESTARMSAAEKSWYGSLTDADREWWEGIRSRRKAVDAERENSKRLSRALSDYENRDKLAGRAMEAQKEYAATFERVHRRKPTAEEVEEITTQFIRIEDMVRSWANIDYLPVALRKVQDVAGDLSKQIRESILLKEAKFREKVLAKSGKLSEQVEEITTEISNDVLKAHVLDIRSQVFAKLPKAEAEAVWEVGFRGHAQEWARNTGRPWEEWLHINIKEFKGYFEGEPLLAFPTGSVYTGNAQKILFQMAEQGDNPIFYTNLADVIIPGVFARQPRIPAGQLRDMIYKVMPDGTLRPKKVTIPGKGSASASIDEIQWSGFQNYLDDFISKNGENAKISQETVDDFFKSNRVKVETIEGKGQYTQFLAGGDREAEGHMFVKWERPADTEFKAGSKNPARFQPQGGLVRRPASPEHWADAPNDMVGWVRWTIRKVLVREGDEFVEKRVFVIEEIQSDWMQGARGTMGPITAEPFRPFFEAIEQALAGNPRKATILWRSLPNSLARILEHVAIEGPGLRTASAGTRRGDTVTLINKLSSLFRDLPPAQEVLRLRTAVERLARWSSDMSTPAPFSVDRALEYLAMAGTEGGLAPSARIAESIVGEIPRRKLVEGTINEIFDNWASVSKRLPPSPARKRMDELARFRELQRQVDTLGVTGPSEHMRRQYRAELELLDTSSNKGFRDTTALGWWTGESDDTWQLINMFEHFHTRLHSGAKTPGPFSKVWKETMFKRALKKAVDEGTDGIAFVPAYATTSGAPFFKLKTHLEDLQRMAKRYTRQWSTSDSPLEWGYGRWRDPSTGRGMPNYAIGAEAKTEYRRVVSDDPKEAALFTEASKPYLAGRIERPPNRGLFGIERRYLGGSADSGTRAFEGYLYETLWRIASPEFKQKATKATLSDMGIPALDSPELGKWFYSSMIPRTTNYRGPDIFNDWSPKIARRVRAEAVSKHNNALRAQGIPEGERRAMLKSYSDGLDVAVLRVEHQQRHGFGPDWIPGSKADILATKAAQDYFNSWETLQYYLPHSPGGQTDDILELIGVAPPWFYRPVSTKELMKSLKRASEGGGSQAVPSNLLADIDSVPTLIFNDAIRAGAKRQRLLQRNAQGAIKGAAEIIEDGRTIIHAFESADITTIIHEMGHIIRRTLGYEHDAVVKQWVRSVIRMKSPAEAATQGTIKVTDATGAWTEEAEEIFARGFERMFLGKGQKFDVPEPMQRVFNKVRGYMGRTYSTLQAHPELGPELSLGAKRALEEIVGAHQRIAVAEIFGPGRRISPEKFRRKIQDVLDSVVGRGEEHAVASKFIDDMAEKMGGEEAFLLKKLTQGTGDIVIDGQDLQRLYSVLDELPAYLEVYHYSNLGILRGQQFLAAMGDPWLTTLRSQTLSTTLNRIIKSTQSYFDPMGTRFGALSEPIIEITKAHQNMFRQAKDEISLIVRQYPTPEAMRKALYLWADGQVSLKTPNGYTVFNQGPRSLFEHLQRYITMHPKYSKEGQESLRVKVVEAVEKGANAEQVEKIMLDFGEAANIGQSESLRALSRVFVTRTEEYSITFGAFDLENIALALLRDEQGSKVTLQSVRDARGNPLVLTLGGKGVDVPTLAPQRLPSGAITGESFRLKRVSSLESLVSELRKAHKLITMHADKLGGKKVTRFSFASEQQASYVTAQIAAHAKIMNETLYDFRRVFGVLDEDIARQMNSMITDPNKAIDVLETVTERYISLQRMPNIRRTKVQQANKNAARISRQLVEVSKTLSGEAVFIPTDLLKEFESIINGLIKDLDAITPEATLLQSYVLGPVGKGLNTYLSWWRQSVLTGILLPNPRYWTNNVLGDWSQMVTSIGVVDGSKLSFQNLFANFEVGGFKPHTTLLELSEKAAGKPVLGTAMNALFNPRLHHIWSGKRGVITLPGGRQLPYDVLRQWLVKDGILDSFTQAELVNEMRAVLESQSWWKKAASPEWLREWQFNLQAHATMVQQRQRTALYLHLLEKGHSRADARKMTLEALYDWRNSFGKAEAAAVTKFLPFWRFHKLAMKQMGVAMTEAWTMPAGQYAKRMLTGRTKYQRMRGQAVVAGNIPNMLSPEDEESWLDDEGRMNLLARVLTPPWAGHLMSYNAPDRLSQPQWDWMRNNLGHKDAAMNRGGYRIWYGPQLTAIHQLEIFSSFFTLATAGVATAAGWKFHGGDTGHYLADGWERQVFEPWGGMMMRPVQMFAGMVAGKAGIDIGFAPGRFQPSRAKLNPGDKVLFSLARLATPFDSFFATGIEDKQGRATANPVALMLLREMPFIGLQVGPMLNKAIKARGFTKADPEWGMWHGLAYYWAAWFGVARPYEYGLEKNASQVTRDLEMRLKAASSGEKYYYEYLKNNYY